MEKSFKATATLVFASLCAGFPLYAEETKLPQYICSSQFEGTNGALHSLDSNNFSVDSTGKIISVLRNSKSSADSIFKPIKTEFFDGFAEYNNDFTWKEMDENGHYGDPTLSLGTRTDNFEDEPAYLGRKLTANSVSFGFKIFGSESMSKDYWDLFYVALVYDDKILEVSNFEYTKPLSFDGKVKDKNGVEIATLGEVFGFFPVPDNQDLFNKKIEMYIVARKSNVPRGLKTLAKLTFFTEFSEKDRAKLQSNLKELVGKNYSDFSLGAYPTSCMKYD